MEVFQRNHQRKFGQNFLIDPHWIQKVLSHTPNQFPWIIEIGPGKGALTKELRAKAQHLTAIELDPLLVEKLQNRWTERPVEVIHQDASRIDIDALLSSKKLPPPLVIGNLPYNMASPIMRHWMKHLQQLHSFQAMVQYEVAKRILSHPGSRDYGLLSAWIQNWSQGRLLEKIPAEAFSPKPRVMSATLELTYRQPVNSNPGFFEFLTQCFSMKRKKLTNNLKKHYPSAKIAEALISQEISVDVRAEALSVETLSAIFEHLGNHQTPMPS